jgi:hypothetical protein
LPAIVSCFPMSGKTGPVCTLERPCNVGTLPRLTPVAAPGTTWAQDPKLMSTSIMAQTQFKTNLGSSANSHTPCSATFKPRNRLLTRQANLGSSKHLPQGCRLSSLGLAPPYSQYLFLLSLQTRCFSTRITTHSIKVQTRPNLPAYRRPIARDAFSGFLLT